MGSKGDNYSDGYCNHHPETCTCRWKDEPSKKNNMDRQKGYYWVKQLTSLKHEIGYFNGWYWFLTIDDITFQDSDFEHINEVRIKQPGKLPD